MQIRTKLSIYFTIVSAVLLLVVMLAIYFLFARHIDNSFFKTLKERAIITAQVYLEADEISDSALQHFKSEFLKSLPGEVIRMYNIVDDKPSFIPDPDQHWKSTLINEVKTKKYVELREKNTQVVGLQYDDNQGSFVILASALDKQGMESKNDLLKILLIFYVIQLLVLFFVGRWFVKKAISPIQKINQRVQRITATDLHIRLNEGGGKDEISELAINFNQLLHRLQTSFEIQKTFIANTSHELRTPITSIMGEIEVALHQNRTIEEYQAALQSTLSEIENLNAIINSFLGLANAEQLFFEKREPVRLDELLWDIKSDYDEKEGAGKLIFEIISLPENDADLAVMANKHLLEIAITNIIRNALKFSTPQPVFCFLENISSGVQVRIVDKGIGIEQEEMSKIFDLFYRSPNASAVEGRGVGLFLAKKVFDLYNAQIKIDSFPGKGTAVNILFAKNKSF